MGAGASTLPLHRVRKVLLIRAYNARSEKDAIQDQFCQYRKRVATTHGTHGTQQDHTALTTSYYLTVDDIKHALKVEQESPWLNQLLQRFQLHQVGNIDYESFVAFLEKGAEPKTIEDVEEGTATATAAADILLQEKKQRKIEETEIGGNEDSEGDRKLPPPSGHSCIGHKASTSTTASGTIAHKEKAEEDDLPAAYKGRRPANVIAEEEEAAIEAQKGPVVYKGEVIESQALVPHKGMTLNSHGKDGVKRPKPVAPLWRKRETLIQERIVEYTTIDADGMIQELVEREKSQTEVMHMECRETGEFAHRESTEYEQTEMFNNELVAEEIGSEEYVHLKSKEDEYEFLDSNMPLRGKAAAAAAGAGGGPGSQTTPTGMPHCPEGLSPRHYTDFADEETMDEGGMGRGPPLDPNDEDYYHHKHQYQSGARHPAFFASSRAGKGGQGSCRVPMDEVDDAERMREERLVGDDNEDAEQAHFASETFSHNPTAREEDRGEQPPVFSGRISSPGATTLRMPPPPADLEGLEPEEWTAAYNAYRAQCQSEQQQQQGSLPPSSSYPDGRVGKMMMHAEEEEEEEEEMDPGEWAAYNAYTMEMMEEAAEYDPEVRAWLDERTRRLQQECEEEGLPEEQQGYQSPPPSSSPGQGNAVPRGTAASSSRSRQGKNDKTIDVTSAGRPSSASSAGVRGRNGGEGRGGGGPRQLRPPAYHGINSSSNMRKEGMVVGQGRVVDGNEIDRESFDYAEEVFDEDGGSVGGGSYHEGEGQSYQYCPRE